MATPLVTGPVHLYVGVFQTIAGSGYGAGLTQLLNPAPSAAYIRYLGSCEHAPQIRIATKWKPLMSDLNGGEQPFDVSYACQDSAITMVLNRLNAVVLETYMAPQPRQGFTPGYNTAADIGLPLLHSAYAVPMYFHFPYYSKFSSVGLRRGYRFLATYPLVEEPIVGTQIGKRILQLQALPVYNPADGSFNLYDQTMTHIPAVPPVGVTGEIS